MRVLSPTFVLTLCSAAMLSIAFAGEEVEKRAPTPLAPKLEAQLSSLFSKLGSEQFVARERAQSQLQQLAQADQEGVLDRTFDTYLNAADPEIRYRLRAAMYDTIMANFRHRGFIGIQMATVPVFGGNGQFEPNSVRVQYVIPNSAAQRFGIQRNDEIIKLDGKPFDPKSGKRATEQLQDYVLSRAEGDPLKLSIRRGGVDMELDIELGAMPESLSEGRRDYEFSRWMHQEKVERGLAKTEDAPGRSLLPAPQITPRLVRPPAQPVPIAPGDLFRDR